MSVIDSRSLVLEGLEPGMLVGIFGQVNSGKTTLARSLAAEYVSRGHQLTVVGVTGSGIEDGQHVEYAGVQHTGIAHTEAEIPPSTTMLVYDGRIPDFNSQSELLGGAAIAHREREAGRIVILVDANPEFARLADINALTGRPSRLFFDHVFGFEAPRDGVPTPGRGIAFVAKLGDEPVMMTYARN